MNVTPLESLVMDAEGCVAAMLTDAEGLPVDWVVVDDAIDAETVAAASGEIAVRGAALLADGLRGSGLHEIQIQAAGHAVLLVPAGEAGLFTAVFDDLQALEKGRVDVLRAASRLEAGLQDAAAAG